MARKIKCLMLPIIILFSACQLFLGPEPDTSPPEILKSLWNDFNNLHANLETRLEIFSSYKSWYDVYNAYAPKVSPNMSEDALFRVCVDMLKEINDPHVMLRYNGGYENSYTPSKTPSSDDWFSNAVVRSQLKEYGNAKQTNFVYGVLWNNPDIGYIWISSFTNDDSETDEEWGRKIDDIIDTLANTKALILDVRENTGGDINITEFIASRFASEHKDYIKSKTKSGPGQNDFSTTKIHTVKSVSKASNNKGYTKPIVLLTNKNTISAAEWFALALRTQSHVTHIGMPTCGAFSMRVTRFMINGWSYSISPERVTDMNDVCWEGKGIPPDKKIPNIIPKPDGPVEDKQLTEAITFLSELIK